MPLAHVTQTGNISIPKLWRTELGIRPNSTVIIEKQNDKIIIEPLGKKEITKALINIRKEIKMKNITFSREEAIKDDLYD